MYRTVLAVLMTFWLAAATATAQTSRDDWKIERAREALKKARENLDTALAHLENIYLQIEKDFKRISGTYSVKFLEGLEKSWTASMPQLKKRWDEEAAKGKIFSRRRFKEFAEPILTEGGRQVIEMDPRLYRPFVETGVGMIYDQFKKNTPFKEMDIHVRLMDLLSPETKIHNFWNDHLFMDVEEAKIYAEANEDFGEIKTALDRLEHPESFTNRGKKVPVRMVFVPGGAYLVGKNTGLERPRRRVNLNGFYIDKYEITNKEYRDFLNALDPELKEEYVPFFWPMNMNMEHYYPEDRADRPVGGVSWKAAFAYARWCGKRLPTEVEWEVAARGKLRYFYPWGNDFDPSLCNAKGSSTTDVGSYPDGASFFGCLDMAGNVWEWTTTDQEGRELKEPDNKVRNMVIRGGDYKDGADHARSDFRWVQPVDPYEGRNPSKKVIGFRCVQNTK